VLSKKVRSQNPDQTGCVALKEIRSCSPHPGQPRRAAGPPRPPSLPVLAAPQPGNEPGAGAQREPFPWRCLARRSCSCWGPERPPSPRVGRRTRGLLGSPSPLAAAPRWRWATDGPGVRATGAWPWVNGDVFQEQTKESKGKRLIQGQAGLRTQPPSPSCGCPQTPSLRRRWPQTDSANRGGKGMAAAWAEPASALGASALRPRSAGGRAARSPCRRPSAAGDGRAPSPPRGADAG